MYNFEKIFNFKLFENLTLNEITTKKRQFHSDINLNSYVKRHSNFNLKYDCDMGVILVRGDVTYNKVGVSKVKSERGSNFIQL